jgi:hypothetical protein
VFPGTAAAKGRNAMQNITQTARSSRIRFFAVLALLATLTSFAAAATRQLSGFFDASRQTRSAAPAPSAWMSNPGCMVACPGSAAVCPGGTQAPAHVFNAP